MSSRLNSFQLSITREYLLNSLNLLRVVLNSSILDRSTSSSSVKNTLARASTLLEYSITSLLSILRVRNYSSSLARQLLFFVYFLNLYTLSLLFISITTIILNTIILTFLIYFIFLERAQLYTIIHLGVYLYNKSLLINQYFSIQLLYSNIQKLVSLFPFLLIRINTSTIYRIQLLILLRNSLMSSLVSSPRKSLIVILVQISFSQKTQIFIFFQTLLSSSLYISIKSLKQVVI